MNPWIGLIPTDVYQRLFNCQTVKSDLPDLLNGMCKFREQKNIPYDKEDLLVQLLELLDENSCGVELTHDEYNELIAYNGES